MYVYINIHREVLSASMFRTAIIHDNVDVSIFSETDTKSAEMFSMEIIERCPAHLFYESRTTDERRAYILLEGYPVGNFLPDIPTFSPDIRQINRVSAVSGKKTGSAHSYSRTFPV